MGVPRDPSGEARGRRILTVVGQGGDGVGTGHRASKAASCISKLINPRVALREHAARAAGPSASPRLARQVQSAIESEMDLFAD